MQIPKLVVNALTSNRGRLKLKYSNDLFTVRRKCSEGSVIMHRVVVIGCGYLEVATRYLAEQLDGILCVGPDEPQDKKAHGGVFGSHYDEGRMTELLTRPDGPFLRKTP